jgi:hypothetical protein
MVGDNSLFGEHGRTIVNGKQRGGSNNPSPSRSHSGGEHRREPERSLLHVATAHDASRRHGSSRSLSSSHSSSSSSRSSPSSSVLPPPDYFKSKRASHSAGLTTGVSMANGVRVIEVSPDDFPNMDRMRSWTMDQLHAEFGRVAGKFPEGLKATGKSRMATEYRTASRQDLLTAISRVHSYAKMKGSKYEGSSFNGGSSRRY